MNIKHHIALLAACAMAFGVISCKTESDDVREKIAPGQVSEVTYTPTNGGAYIKYTVPTDEDFLYVRAEYTLDNGQVISRSSSIYTDSLVISGFGQVKPYPVKLYSCDYFANESDPVVVDVTPLEPNVTAVAETVRVRPGFAGIVIELENPALEAVDVYVDIATADGRSATRVFTSKVAKDMLTIVDLEPIPYSVKTHVEDSYGNKTPDVDKGSVTPLSDYELSKEGWSFLSDPLLYGSHWNKSTSKPYDDYIGVYTLDSMKNAMEYRYDGSVYKFWDGITDTGEDRNKGYNSFFHSGYTDKGGYPFSYFIDMNRNMQISRVRVWQRYDYLWTTYGPKTFEIWISDDKTPEDGIFEGWELTGLYSIEKPATDAEAAQAAIDGHEFWIYPAEAAFTKTFRYLRFKCIKDFTGKGTIGCLAEMTLYGQDM